MTLQQKQAIFAQNLARLIVYVDTIGMTCTIGEVMRTPEQAQIYAQKGIGIKDSLHCKKLAVDMFLFNDAGKYLEDFKSYEQLGTYWKSLNINNRWGGDWKKKDLVHFEMMDV